MPCFGPTDAEMEVYESNRKNGTLTPLSIRPVLCGVLTVLENIDPDWADKVDWDEVGVSRKRAENWWERHKLEDLERRENEIKEQRKEAIRKKALEKMTDEEREALGL